MRLLVRFILVVIALLCPSAAAYAVPVPVPVTTPVTDHCPHKVATPPAVDTSEVVAPGAPVPSPLPVPDPPVGGARLAGCGVVAEPGAGQVPGRLTSAGWLIADLDTGKIIAAKDPHGRYRPASTVKVLLALVVLDAIDRGTMDLDAVVTATPADWSAEGDSCGMGPGGHYTIRDLVTGLIVVSGNDCADALTRQLGGVDATLAAMNDKAHSLLALDTHASTPSGLDAAGMSTSPYDLALIYREAMHDSLFRELIGLRDYRFPGYPKRPDVPGDKDHPGYLMQTSNQLLLDGYAGMLGGKTGYTDDARKTFVGATERDGRRVVIVQMYGLTVESDSYWDQAESMYDYGFRAPTGTEVGLLVTSSTGRPAPATTATATPDPAQAMSATGTDHPDRWSIRILVGLCAALIAIGLLLVALRLFARR
ncbi:D-alanyl-D-alanine carboxypeptidase family protein [Gordonia sp. DT218]|uniref:D-alanyl-D-alanine carboxypeptidase family protein n=1 Tax=Gordonia sp. DT218 TaxID=3416659 RepID=UPI003CF6D56B